ncbi:carbonic anhydrase, family 3 [Candidatus Rhodobacter oscarellae]|uniref:Carbonic anhydrase, family 3 n=1 Tax=Candidatus Rhodobacter oscarellae TaxID=1675527 RepID=A0A0J9E3A8_9RHOB|nr:gamma carbonic anhydrase family protein [Candidatus Rhodobacter lobularis]KMW57260.1 carbonic anhydrase, family 3 [Candidatus Rhodobacter lobularis]
MTLYALGEHRPQTPEDGDFYVAPGAHVIGQCVLHKASSIWFGAALRGDNEPITLGEGSNIQENSVLHTDAGFPLNIGKNCTIGHKAMLHGCTIEDGALIGMGATVLNGAVIGAGALVGAGALIPEGKVIPPGVLVLGAPGKVVRELTDQHRQTMLAAALHYQERGREYKSQLVALP